MTDDLSHLDATAQADLVRRGEVTPLELVDAAIARVEASNPALNAVIHERFDRARTEAAGTLPDGPFRGVPMLLKDLDGSLAGEPVHLGNRLLKAIGHTGATSNYLFDKFHAAGVVVIGKTNTPEFGLLPTTEPEAYGATHNPWSLDHSPGGSSGGSAAAVAAGMVPVAHAGDGGGSIRIPASHCGIYGLKPSRGRSSLGPDVGEAWAGLVVRHVVSRSVRDSAAFLDAITGPMSGDPYTAPPPARPYAAEVGAEPGRLRIGLCTAAPNGLAEVDPACVAATEDAARLLESLGHTVEVAKPAAFDVPGLLETFSAVLCATVVHEIDHLAEIVGRPVTSDDVEALTWFQYEMGQGITAGQYLGALSVAHSWSRAVCEWWQTGFDLLLTPVCAEPPPLLGDVHATPDDPYRALGRGLPFGAFTAGFNITGQPAVSVPLHWTDAGLPIGVQLVADQYREDVLLRVSAQLEQARPWADRHPPRATG
ncbi:MAG: amidase [Actinomycetes bacterium]